MDTLVILTIVFSIILVCLTVVGATFILWKTAKDKKRIREQINSLANNTLELTPQEFMEMRNKKIGGSSYALSRNFAGVYILFNKTKNLYYVGQGQQILNRVNAHFTGHGNGDVYADYKYGDAFTIKMISLENSGCSSLNELERKAIMTFDSVAHGYNKTRGNRG